MKARSDDAGVALQFRFGFLVCSFTPAVIFRWPCCGGHVAQFDRAGGRHTGNHTLRAVPGGAAVDPANTPLSNRG